MGSQSLTKTIFLLASMVGWLLVGAALMYLCPFLADRVIASDLTHRWMESLHRSGYDARLGWMGGGAVLGVTVAAQLIWYRRFEGKV